MRVLKAIVILGSTGSIGQQTLEIVRAFPKEFSIVGLAGWRNLELLAKQVQEFKPAYVSCDAATENVSRFPSLSHSKAISMQEMVALPEVDLVVMATTGRVGLEPTLAAIRAKKSIALSNKEVMVMAGQLITTEARRHGAALLPVDSEPSAIWQCLQGENSEIARIILTASGGPFRRRPLEEMATVTLEETLMHPTWKMGKKITVDSATLMNKAFEVIETRWLFNLPWEHIQVVIHPQSIIHSMVEFVDGSVKAQLSPPDMRLPIQYALFHPKRIANQALPRFDPLATGALTFEPMDTRRFPCFQTALEAARRGATYAAVLNAADEVAVELFLERRIPFTDIHRLVSQVLDAHKPVKDTSLKSILAADKWARVMALELAGH